MREVFVVGQDGKSLETGSGVSGVMERDRRLKSGGSRDNNHTNIGSVVDISGYGVGCSMKSLKPIRAMSTRSLLFAHIFNRKSINFGNDPPPSRIQNCDARSPLKKGASSP